jgi:hypothetical protein
MVGFLEYSDIGFRAFVFSIKQQEIINRKHSIVQSVYDYHKVVPHTVLFIGFNPAILACKAQKVYVAELSSEADTWLQNQGVEYTSISTDDLGNYHDQFDAIVAMEEAFTFADSEEVQKSTFDMICKAARGVVITTLRDYKNQEFKDREFSIPAVIKNDNETRLLVEYHDYDVADRNSWTRSVYEITGNDLRSNLGFLCRHMFFKQCAKFGYDAGARDFVIHKNLMYKSLIKKNYEHVISIKF